MGTKTNKAKGKARVVFGWGIVRAPYGVGQLPWIEGPNTAYGINPHTFR